MKTETQSLNVIETEARAGYLARMKKERDETFWKNLKGRWWIDRYNEVSLVTSDKWAVAIISCILAALLSLLAWKYLELHTTLFLIIGGVYSVGSLIAWLRHRYDANKKLKNFSKRELILEFQRKRIEDIKEESIGTKTVFHEKICSFREKYRLLMTSHRKISALRTLHTLRFASETSVTLNVTLEKPIISLADLDERFSHTLTTMKEPASLTYLRLLEKKLDDRMKEIGQVVQKGDAFIDRVNVWVSERLAEIDRLDETLKEREQIEEALQICEETKGATDEIDLVIAQAVGTIVKQIQDAHEEIRRYYELSGVALAITAAETGETFDMKMLDRVIADHVPAKLEIVKKVA